MSGIILAVKQIMKDPKYIFRIMNSHGILRILPDRPFLKLMWWVETGSRLNLKNPKGFNEKLQWLKLYDRRPEYTRYTDKILVRDFVRDTIGEEHLVPLIGIWDSPEEIDFDSLPDQFVLKCNHNSGGGMCICTDKSKLDVQNIKNKLKASLHKNIFFDKREWPYKNIVPRILCEQFMVDHDPQNTSGTLIDYKFHCFNGEPKFLYVGTDDISSGTKGELKLSFFDLDWKISPFYRSDHKPIAIDVEKPKCFDEMIDIARKLSKGIPFVRVDLYWVNGQILFSEMTFFPGGGNGYFSPEEWENRLGDWIVLPGKS